MQFVMLRKITNKIEWTATIRLRRHNRVTNKIFIPIQKQRLFKNSLYAMGDRNQGSEQSFPKEIMSPDEMSKSIDLLFETGYIFPFSSTRIFAVKKAVISLNLNTLWIF